jgi:hypothetical protein
MDVTRKMSVFALPSSVVTMIVPEIKYSIYNSWLLSLDHYTARQRLCAIFSKAFDVVNRKVAFYFWFLVLGFLHGVRSKFSDYVSEPTAARETSSENLPRTPYKNPKAKNLFSFHGVSLISWLPSICCSVVQLNDKISFNKTDNLLVK